MNPAPFKKLNLGLLTQCTLSKVQRWCPHDIKSYWRGRTYTTTRLHNYLYYYTETVMVLYHIRFVFGFHSTYTCAFLLKGSRPITVIFIKSRLRLAVSFIIYKDRRDKQTRLTNGGQSKGPDSKTQNCGCRGDARLMYCTDLIHHRCRPNSSDVCYGHCRILFAAANANDCTSF